MECSSPMANTRTISVTIACGHLVVRTLPASRGGQLSPRRSKATRTVGRRLLVLCGNGLTVHPAWFILFDTICMPAQPTAGGGCTSSTRMAMRRTCLWLEGCQGSREQAGVLGFRTVARRGGHCAFGAEPSGCCRRSFDALPSLLQLARKRLISGRRIRFD